jgi:hypothetical protein
MPWLERQFPRRRHDQAASVPDGSFDAVMSNVALHIFPERVLWLATRIVDAANHDHDTGDGVKVGGHRRRAPAW